MPPDGFGRIRNCAWLPEVESHPDFRHQGLGNYLLAWAESRAAELFQTGKSIHMVITNEALSEDAQRLYLQQGYEQVMAEEMRVYDLSRPVLAFDLPGGIAIYPWSAQTISRFYATYQNSFQDRPGFPGLSAEKWINNNIEYDGFRPDLSLLAQFSDEPVGFLTADAKNGLGWISQVGVVPAWRGKGVAAALIGIVLGRFKGEGFKQAALHVNVNNPSASHLYSQLGFVYHLKRARYVKEIKFRSHRELD